MYYYRSMFLKLFGNRLQMKPLYMESATSFRGQSLNQNMRVLKEVKQKVENGCKCHGMFDVQSSVQVIQGRFSIISHLKT